MHSDAATVADYVSELDGGRREQVQTTLDLLRPHLPQGLQESMDYGMITWTIPLSVAPDTYNGKPLMFGGLASQKNHISLYLTCLYVGVPMSEEEFRAQWSAPKKLNMGKSCIRYRSVEDIDVSLIQRVLGETTLSGLITAYDRTRTQRRKR